MHNLNTAFSPEVVVYCNCSRLLIPESTGGEHHTDREERFAVEVWRWGLCAGRMHLLALPSRGVEALSITISHSSCQQPVQTKVLVELQQKASGSIYNSKKCTKCVYLIA